MTSLSLAWARPGTRRTYSVLRGIAFLARSPGAMDERRAYRTGWCLGRARSVLRCDTSFKLRDGGIEISERLVRHVHDWFIHEGIDMKILGRH
jgi:hypothetical protein